ncbi:hypothetical protein GCM10009841_15530 [Microlunatus panaciterrae]|uniref:Uncharacterized protein n=1 Tax=Microlunatus panaciterrae TaxID=400768 RepID=A0ABS2RM77_9ACTN|nr:hypothetical protein [Microlunatus panaciterrae]MBM7800111.1 hypothetical protein [Microlunatus panaciterrae]
MSWRWQADKPRGVVIDAAGLGLEQTFPAQGDAESWLGEAYPELAEAGVTAVSLFEGDRLVYGPMSLAPEGT